MGIGPRFLPVRGLRQASLPFLTQSPQALGWDFTHWGLGWLSATKRSFFLRH